MGAVKCQRTLGNLSSQEDNTVEDVDQKMNWKFQLESREWLNVFTVTVLHLNFGKVFVRNIEFQMET